MLMQRLPQNGAGANQSNESCTCCLGACYLLLQLSLWLVGICAILWKASSFSWQRVPRNCAREDCYEWRVCFICLGLSQSRFANAFPCILSIIEKTVNQSGSPSLQRWSCIHLEDVRDRFEAPKLPHTLQDSSNWLYILTPHPSWAMLFVKELSSSIKIAMPKWQAYSSY